jgi:hypothetical protein
MAVERDEDEDEEFVEEMEELGRDKHDDYIPNDKTGSNPLGGGRPKGSPNKVYNLKDIIFGLIKIQDRRIKRMYNEETSRWNQKAKEKENKGHRTLDPGLSKEISTAINLVDCLFKVGGNIPEGKVKKNSKDDAKDQAEKLDSQLKKKMANLARQVNGG